MKVISGKLKGRVIQGFNITGTRPTMDRVKESLFAMIQDFTKESICLDLFSGSGNLGIEALSNNARMCYFVDNNRKAIEVINKNIKDFNLESFSKVMHMDYLKALNSLLKEEIRFDLIFLDPPYKADYIKKIMNLLDNTNLLKNNGLVICELDRCEILGKYNTLIEYKKRQYSDKWIVIFKKNIDKKVNIEI